MKVKRGDAPQLRGAAPRIRGDAPSLLFDGVCNLCNGAVRFIIKRDPAGYFRFVSLQSELGKKLLADCGLPEMDGGMDTLVLLEQGNCYVRSTAALRTARRLKTPWNWLYVLILVPRPIRDWLYGVVARRRYRWFGKRDQCMMPPAEYRDRFL